jgi:hypothetical protein
LSGRNHGPDIHICWESPRSLGIEYMSKMGSFYIVGQKIWKNGRTGFFSTVKGLHEKKPFAKLEKKKKVRNLYFYQ